MTYIFRLLSVSSVRLYYQETILFFCEMGDVVQHLREIPIDPQMKLIFTSRGRPPHTFHFF